MEDDYFGLASTSGVGDGEEVEGDEDAAEEAAEHIVGQVDTGALGIDVNALLQAPQRMLQGLINMGHPPAAARRIAPKVAKKVPAKMRARPAMRLAPPRALAPRGPLHLPGGFAGGMGGGHSGGGKLLTLEQLADLCQFRQIANYEGTIGAGLSVDIDVDVTINGWIFDWSISDAASELVIQKCAYLQDTWTVYGAQSLGGWSPKAAKKAHVQPLEATAPNKVKATVFNPTTDPVYLPFAMIGLAIADIPRVIAHPDVAYTLRHKGLLIQNAAF